MKYIIIIVLFIININSKVIDSKQLFNRSLSKVKEIRYEIKKTFYATTTYDETKINDVVLRFSGFIKNLKANYEHKQINRGDKLFSIYSKEVSASLDEFIIALKDKNSKYLLRNIEERLELLDISKRTINKIKQLKKVLYYIDIHSKYQGIIINKVINESSYAKEGQLLMRIADLSTIWVNANIYQKDLSFIKKNMRANVYIDGLGNFDAKVDFIHPIVKGKNRTIPVRLIVKNKNMNIFPNMFAKVTFKKEKLTMLILPKSAVITKGLTHYVFKPTENSEFEPIEVEAKRINSKQFQIVSGLKKDEVVINNALFMLDSDAITNGLYDEDDDDDW